MGQPEGSRAMTDETQPGSPVTAVVTRTVKPGHQDEYRRWLTRLLSAAEAFPNNLGTVVFAPARPPGLRGQGQSGLQRAEVQHFLRNRDMKINVASRLAAKTHPGCTVTIIISPPEAASTVDA
jgi:hypothetical protein